MKTYDTVIVGSGTAGLSAAIYASRARLDTLVLERHMMSGGQILQTYEVDNYLGLPGLNGFDLATKFREHADRLEVPFETDHVRELRVDGAYKIVACEGASYRAKTVLVAAGATHRLLGVDGEERLSGRGVSYCATCDGAFFRNKTVAVVGGGDVAVEDALYLARLSKTVYLIHRRDSLRASKVLQERLFATENITPVWNTEVERILGENAVNGLVLRSVNTGGQTELPVDGVFIAVGIQPNSEPFSQVLQTDAGGFIVAGEDCATSMEGVYAAGDIRTKACRQIITAAADGANAVFSAEKWIGTHF